jgi:lipopolysaccharide transport system permease protein
MKTIIYSDAKAKLNFQEILNYRGLLKNIAYRDVTVRYKQTWMGMIWVLVKPLMNIAIFGAISLLITKPENIAQNFLSVGAAVVIWNLMASCISDSSNSLIANSNLLTKVYFPKIILPVASVFVCLIDFAIAFSIYLVFFIIFNGLPGFHFLLFPVFVFLAVFLCLSLGLMFSALNVKYRDVNFALPFFLQFAFYVSPVFLSTKVYLSYLPVWLQKIFLLNPAVFILDGFKYSLFGTWEVYDIQSALLSMLVMVLLFVVGLRYFLKFEKSFADYI